MDETEKRRQQRRQILANGGDPFKETVSRDFVVVVFHPDPGSRVKKAPDPDPQQRVYRMYRIFNL
jgi:hypothetical protein